MVGWWNGLSALNRGFYCAALFFSALFAWQLIAALVGVGGDGDDGSWSDHASGADAAETMHAFELLSLRSIVTFLTLFSWGGALYLSDGESVGYALGVSAAWGLAGMLAVALVLRGMRRLTHSGNLRLETSVGGAATVYLDIPAGGEGEVRAEVSGVLSHVRARTADGRALKAGAAVVVSRVLRANLVEVRPAERGEG